MRGKNEGIWFPEKDAKRLGRIGNVVRETQAGAQCDSRPRDCKR